MKHTIANPDQEPQIETNNKAFDHIGCHSAYYPIEPISFNRFAYSYPFVPMFDLTLIFDELGKMIADFFTKRKNRNTHKNKLS
jgi:hypothetical protein